MSIQPRPALLALSIAAASLAGCAKDTGAYPSLDRRPIERVGAIGTPSAPPPNAPLSPELPARLDTLAAQARAAHARFVEQLPAARRRIREGSRAAIGSDAWGDAQVALASLESARSQTMLPLADLDLLLTERATQDLARDVERIVATRDMVAALVAQEDAALGTLRP
ncbi:hypothetical protein [Croceicoccus hydrothermalis]|uniref:hypothetical protein n=1 Tax=Croceicoccus hydrothermalis TaxID=2867964 RepID=UPI001EFA3A7F|nr:hypothetical protein [Croceicoccus hydrothermalis]